MRQFVPDPQAVNQLLCIINVLTLLSKSERVFRSRLEIKSLLFQIVLHYFPGQIDCKLKTLNEPISLQFVQFIHLYGLLESGKRFIKILSALYPADVTVFHNVRSYSGARTDLSFSSWLNIAYNYGIGFHNCKLIREVVQLYVKIWEAS